MCPNSKPASSRVGFEAAYAVEQQKYVLALSLHEDFSQKIKNHYFKGARYSEVTIDNIVEHFIAFSKNHQYSERFNFFLSSSQLEHVRSEAEKKGLNQSEYVRLLIDERRFGET